MALVEIGYATTWLVVAIVQALFTAAFFARTRAIVPTAFSLGFILLFPVLGATNFLLGEVPDCDGLGVFAAALSTTLYLVLLLTVIAMWPGVFSASNWFRTVEAIPTQVIAGSLGFWLIVKVHLFVEYGLDVILVRQVSYFTELPFSYWESIANSVARTLLVAMALLVTLRAALRVERTPIVVAVGIALIAHFIMGDADAGTRRTLLTLALVYLLARWVLTKGHHWRLVLQTFIMVMMLGGIGVYYTYIRGNLYDTELQIQLLSGTTTTTLAGISALFTPRSDAVSEGAARVTREGPMELLCRLTDRQWQKSTTSEGDLTLANLYRAIPRFVLQDKVVVDLDMIMADAHDMYPREEYSYVDLATSQLAQLQSDFGPAGWFLAPLVNAAALLAFGAAFVSRRLGAVSKIFALGALWAVMGSAENTLATIATSLRDFILLAALSEALRIAYSWGKLNSNYHPSPLIPTRKFR